MSVPDDRPIPWVQMRHCDLPGPSRKDGCTALMRDHGWKAGEEICPADFPQRTESDHTASVILCTDLRGEP